MLSKVKFFQSTYLLFVKRKNVCAKCVMYAQNASKLTNEMHQGEKKTERYFSGSTFRAQGVKMYFFHFTLFKSPSF